MPEPTTISRARLQQIRLADGDRPSEVTDPGATVEVQFNPETLSVSYANEVTGDDAAGGAAIQYVTKSSTTLGAELWFDATLIEGVEDVREATNKVKHFLTPIQQGDGLAPPAVRFLWGSFLFEGVLHAVDEALELFSAAGRPLRAKVTISIISQELELRIAQPAGGGGAPSGGAGPPGIDPGSALRPGESLQQALGRSGDPTGWQAVAAASGIENPRFPDPGFAARMG